MDKIAVLPSRLRQYSGFMSSRLQLKFNHRYNAAKRVYEDLFGVKSVQEAQDRVLESEKSFVTAQDKRREAHKALSESQRRLREVRGDLDRTHRGEVGYLELLSKEIQCIKEEALLREQFEEVESIERKEFTSLSLALQESHARERIRSEKTKYWGLGGSLIGALLGLLAGLSQGRWRRVVTKEDLNVLTEKMDNLEKSLALPEFLSSIKNLEKLLGLSLDLFEPHGSMEEMSNTTNSISSSSSSRLKLGATSLRESSLNDQNPIFSQNESTRRELHGELVLTSLVSMAIGIILARILSR